MQDEDEMTNVGRRRALQLGAGGAMAVALAGAVPGAAAGAADRQRGDGSAMGRGAIEPGAGSWATWLVPADRDFGVGRPPTGRAARAELDELERLAAGRDAAARARIAYWDAGSPGYRWNELAIEQGRLDGILLLAYRMLALLNVAVYDATIAVWRAKYRYDRKRPAEERPKLTPAIPTPASPSYPSEHAATAAAASAVLTYLFPAHSDRWATLAREHGQSRLEAGVEYPSDVAAGGSIGRAVGEAVVSWARADRSDLPWTGTVPVGPGLWQGDPASLALPAMGSWATWVLAGGSELRPGPPPAFDSAQRAAELAEVKGYPRDSAPGTELSYWPDGPSGPQAPDSAPFSSNQTVFHWAPVLHFLWFNELCQKLSEYHLDLNPPRAARAHALVSVAGYDATVASWDAKFHYWTGRPIHFDPTITTVLPTYPIPDYPSGHATTLGGTSRVLEHLFPADARSFAARAEENALSRLWAGIHFRSACEGGVALGRAVGDKVVARARSDGAG